MKRILVACLIVSATFYSTALIAQSIDEETIIIDDKNAEGKTVIEIEKNGDVIIDGKKVATRDQNGDKIKIIKKKTFVTSNINEFPFDVPMKFKGNKALLGVKTKKANKGGAEVIEVIPNSAAEKALIKVGDVITQINDQDITNPTDLSDAIGKCEAGESVKLKIENGNESYTARTKLGKNEEMSVRVFDNNNLPQLFKELDIQSMIPDGIRMNTQNAKPKFGMTVEENDTDGLKVIEVKPSSSAAKAGLTKGDVILKVENKNVNDPQEFMQAVSRNMNNQKISVLIKRGNYEKNLSMEVPKVRRRAEL